MPGGHLGSGLDGYLVAVAVRVAVVVETGDGDPPPALAGGTRLKNVGDSAWVNGVDGGSLGDGEVGGGVVVVAATDLSQGDRVVGEGEGVETVGGDLTLGEPEGAVVVDPSGDGGDVFVGVVVTPQGPGEVCRAGVVGGLGRQRWATVARAASPTFCGSAVPSWLASCPKLRQEPGRN